jgi:pimeloyl-ACP methyl ester carboxylesterase
MTTEPRTDTDEPRLLRLRDGRALAFAEYGDPKGAPVIFFHGLPSCRLMHPDAGTSRALGVRVLVADRPGFGRSDPKPGRSLLDWANDVAELADALELRQFALAGPSGGGPFVAACASKLASRITRAAILGGSGPLDAPGALAGITLERRVGYGLARHAPALLRLALRWRGDPRRDPERFFASYTRHNPPADQALLARPEVRAMFLASYAEATRQGLGAFAWEVELVARPWGFRLEDLRVPIVIWHGADDHLTPVGMAQAQARAIPHATLRILPGEGHLFFLSRWEEIVSELLAPAVTTSARPSTSTHPAGSSPIHSTHPRS